ncbi:MAG: translation initiation factor IF-2 [Chthonomonas sp.]|nr:translation initiation factor IF-2 [Chthonomonas sp.]
MSSNSIATLAKEFEITPGQVTSVLSELGVLFDGDEFVAEADELSIIKETLGEQRGQKVLVLAPGANVRDIAASLDKQPQDLIKDLLLKHKTPAQLTTSLAPEVAEKLAGGYGFSIKWQVAETKTEAPKKLIASTAAVKPISGAQHRPPVVTIMGHVDHGKTSLLDYIRKTRVVDKEHGGITQHIGAYQVELPEGKITFLDTPGHAAFTAMRARGAQVTDIAILVVAADDGLMPQTLEAIGHIKAAGVPMVIAINKIDKPSANPDKVMQMLMAQEVVVEAYGGQVGSVNVSALTGEGVPALLERILLEAELLDLKADPRGDFRGVVIEAKLDKGRGAVATILVQEGTLKISDSIVVGSAFGKIKAMTDYTGASIKEAGPSVPVEILGLNEVPGAGDKVEAAENEKVARAIGEQRATEARDKSLMTGKRKISLGDLRRQMDEEDVKNLNLIVKADVQGSVEAVRGLLEKVKNDEVEVKVIYAGVGQPSESDILLASAAGGIIVGFNVKADAKTKTEAERAKVEIRSYNVIYELIEDIEAAVKGMLAPKFEEHGLGTAEIRLVFKLTRAGFVAGSYVQEGMIKRGAECRVRRAGEIVYTGKIDSLKHIKQDVREMTAGQECGIQFENWTDFKEGDLVEAFEMVQIMD